MNMAQVPDRNNTKRRAGANSIVLKTQRSMDTEKNEAENSFRQRESASCHKEDGPKSQTAFNVGIPFPACGVDLFLDPCPPKVLPGRYCVKSSGSAICCPKEHTEPAECCTLAWWTYFLQVLFTASGGLSETKILINGIDLRVCLLHHWGPGEKQYDRHTRQFWHDKGDHADGLFFNAMFSWRCLFEFFKDKARKRLEKLAAFCVAFFTINCPETLRLNKKHLVVQKNGFPLLREGGD